MATDKTIKYEVTCKIDGIYFKEIIVCNKMFIANGAYLFLDGNGWGTYDYENVKKSFPVMFTVVKRINDTSNEDE